MRVMRLVKFLLLGALSIGVIVFGGKSLKRDCNGGSPGKVRITRGAGGVGFLPLLVMDKLDLIETQAKKRGIDLKASFPEVGGPTAVNYALLSGSIDFVAAGPPAFLILWANSDHCKVMGVSAMTSLPMHLNARDARLQTLDDFTDNDKIAVTAVDVSIPAIAIQMYAAEKHGPSEWNLFDRFTVQMTHSDGVGALKSGIVSAHYTSPPFAQRELKEPGVHTVITTDDIMKGSSTFTMLSTTTAFYEKNPEVVTAVMAALAEANQLIRDDKKWAADILLHETGKSDFTANEIDEMFDAVNDPAVKFTMTPENIMKYAEHMYNVGTLEKKPSNWKEMFLPEIYEVYGAQGN
jgi:NitT/TauT family transport system substrate-binding protein